MRNKYRFASFMYVYSRVYPVLTNIKVNKSEIFTFKKQTQTTILCLGGVERIGTESFQKNTLMITVFSNKDLL